MEIEEIKLISKDGTSLHCQIWDCPNPEAVVCIIHGLGEHINRYTHVAEFFNTNNIAVFAYDQRGHGKSEGKRGHTPSYDLLLDDVEELLKLARSEYNDLPIFLYGHSLGGNIVSNYALRRPTNELKGVIISSPWLKLAVEPPSFQVKLAKFVSGILPFFTQPNGLDVSDLSYDQSVVTDYANDPLVHDKISTKLFTTVYNAGKWAIENADRLKIPALVFHGADDRITSALGTEEFSKKAGTYVTFQLWENMKHETHNELKKEDVLNFIFDWIDQRLD